MKEPQRPVASVLESSRLKGKSTGLVVTSQVMHATPAGFACHYPDRENFEVLGDQLLHNGLDVVMGGGYTNFLKDSRSDRQDLLSEIKLKGYNLVTNRAELRNSDSGKLWGLFAPGPMNYDIDRNIENEPSLSEMTEKALFLSVLKTPTGSF